MKPSFLKAWFVVILYGSTLGASVALAATARVVGRIHDPAGLAIAGVKISLTASIPGTGLSTRSGPDGKFEFDDVPPGPCRVTAVATGYREAGVDLELKSGELTRVFFSLPLASYSETVTAVAEPETQGVNPPTSVDRLQGTTLELLPLVSDRFIEVLPLLPGVIRTPDGKLSFNGARGSQSTVQVNGTTVTDPLTGEFAVELPLKAIEEVEVTSFPYAPEFGRVTSAVTKVLTRAGGDSFRVEVGNFFPSPRFKNGKIVVGTFTPDVRVSGPLRAGKAWFSQSFAYRFVRFRAYDIEEGEDESVLRNVDVLSQLDVKLSDKHYLTTTFSYFPIGTDNLGLDSLHKEAATPNFRSWGWNAAVFERAALSDRTLVETQLAYKNFDVATRPQGQGAMRVLPTGFEGNYFNTFDRESSQVELNWALTRVVGATGKHVVKVGANVNHSRFHGIDRNSEINVLGGDGRLLRTIDFVGEPDVRGDDTEIGGYVQDRWRPNERLTIEFGTRYDFDRVSGSHRPVPRVAVAYAPFADGRSVVRGGWGIFYDRVLLHASSYEQFQRRRETEYGDDGQPGAPLLLDNRFGPEGLSPPRAITWNLEFDRRIADRMMFRANLTERRGTNEVIVDRLTSPRPELLLSSRGTSTFRQIDLTLKKRFPRGGELLFSYAYSRSRRDLNGFEELFGNRREPIVLASEYSLDPNDVPHRWLTWGVLKLPKGIEVAPSVEIRTGFPYTVVDERQNVVGARNRGGRFPIFFSADLRVTKDLVLFHKYRVTIGGSFYNVTNHFNPRDVHANQESPLFGQLFNGPRVSLALRLSVGHAR